jgi:pimeloyl-ACP methyl ester carboxylesterase
MTAVMERSSRQSDYSKEGASGGTSHTPYGYSTGCEAEPTSQHDDPRQAWSVISAQDTYQHSNLLRFRFGMAKHAASRVQSLMIGGAHPYADSVEAFRDVDGTDPEAFIGALEKFSGIRATPEIRERILGNDLQALAAAMHDRDSLEEVISTMTMPCFLYVGKDDPRLPKVEACVKDLPNATFVSFPSLNHAQAYMRSDLVLPHIAKFLQAVSKSE